MLAVRQPSSRYGELEVFPAISPQYARFLHSAHDWHGSCNKESQPNAAESTQSAASSRAVSKAPHVTVADRSFFGPQAANVW
jgi:hypothetical protein